MIGNKKVGVGIATYNRPEGLLKLYNSLPFDIIDEIIIVNDGEYQSAFDDIPHLVVNNEVNLGVGKSKNIALKYLLSKKCEHFFLLEDDIYIKNPSVFERYIYVSKITGIQHLNSASMGMAIKMKIKNPGLI
ncbi:glycosyltransferase family 2 protein [Pectobacterium sp. B2J-2]|uniref:glycosyltransferase family 2 protein n=1 Tax=Pectobacterium sp. B2J-2 TaxID=3385372 RepID=UPI0038FCC1F0